MNFLGLEKIFSFKLQGQALFKGLSETLTSICFSGRYNPEAMSVFIAIVYILHFLPRSGFTAETVSRNERFGFVEYSLYRL